MSDTQQSTERKTLTAIVKASSFDEPKAGGKCISVTFKFKGDKPEGFTNATFKALAHTDTWKVEDFADDETFSEVTWEVQPPAAGKEANGPTYWLMKYAGKEKAAYVPKLGGGGKGGGYVKTAEEIHSASICGIIKSAMEYSSVQCADIGNYPACFDTIANAALEKYWASMAKAKATHALKDAA